MAALTENVVQQYLKDNQDELAGGVLKVCICGGGGFIGSHIAKRLKAEVYLLSTVQTRTCVAFKMIIFSHSLSGLLRYLC